MRDGGDAATHDLTSTSALSRFPQARHDAFRHPTRPFRPKVVPEHSRVVRQTIGLAILSVLRKRGAVDHVVSGVPRVFDERDKRRKGSVPKKLGTDALYVGARDGKKFLVEKHTLKCVFERIDILRWNNNPKPLKHKEPNL